MRGQVLCSALVLAAGALAGGCGGSRPHQKPASAAALLAETFAAHSSASSGRVALSLSLGAGAHELFALRAAGPFRVGPSGSAASFALSLRLRWRAPGRPARTLAMTLLAGPRALSVSVGSRRLRLPADAARALQAGYAQAQSSPGASTGASDALAPLGLHPARWVARARLAGATGRGAQATDRLTGALALAPFLGELTRLASLSTGLPALAGDGGEASGAAAALTAPALKDRGSGQVELYSGERDHLLRALSASAALAPPAGSREGAGRALSISFTLSFSALGQPQRIPAP